MNASRAAHCSFIPPWLSELVDGPEQAAADEALRARRASGVRPPAAGPAEDLVEGAAWTVHDAKSITRLPGTPARSAGEPGTSDVAVDEAATGIEATLAMFADALARDSHDGAGAPVSLTVHYGSRYNNAFWDGTQLVFGEGDGRVFERFTKPIDVLAHEFGHAVVQHTCDLAYRGQQGALNESVADVFAACVKQRVLGQDAAGGDWLIGEGLFAASVQARALRDMAAPGTAYDDPELGADPQVGHLDDYVDTTADNGGVHLNSGIPNRAFHLAATAIGGTAIEGAGRIWYAAITGGDVTSTTDFAGFAAATVAAAGPHADAVREAWAQVGVQPPPGASPVPDPAPESGAVRVRRSGGFAGRTESGEVAISGLDDDLRAVLARVDLSRFGGGLPKPDMFVYTFEVPGQPVAEVPEHQLDDDLRELARRVLGRGGLV